jgi:hypothetical protein
LGNTDCSSTVWPSCIDPIGWLKIKKPHAPSFLHQAFRQSRRHQSRREQFMASSSLSYKRKRTDEHEGPSKWRTRRAKEAYSHKLIDALRLVRAGAPAARGRQVRDAADRALAAAARGRSRWSRAILDRQRRRSTTLRRVQASAAASTSSSTQKKQQPAVARKAKMLGRLVPGCRKLPFPALLAEVSDYVAALEMQVRAMNAVAQALSSVVSAAPSSLS